MKRDYLRDFSGFISEAYNDVPHKNLIDAVERLHSAQDELKRAELEYIKSGGDIAAFNSSAINNKLREIARLEFEVNDYYGKSRMKPFPFVER
jgi:hypothetical protein